MADPGRQETRGACASVTGGGGGGEAWGWARRRTASCAGAPLLRLCLFPPHHVSTFHAVHALCCERAPLQVLMTSSQRIGPVVSLAVAADGRTLLTGHSDCTSHVWQVRAALGACPYPLTAPVPMPALHVGHAGIAGIECGLPCASAASFVPPPFPSPVSRPHPPVGAVVRSAQPNRGAPGRRPGPGGPSPCVAVHALPVPHLCSVRPGEGCVLLARSALRGPAHARRLCAVVVVLA